jgi:hypothetical protein
VTFTIFGTNWMVSFDDNLDHTPSVSIGSTRPSTSCVTASWSASSVICLVGAGSGSYLNRRGYMPLVHGPIGSQLRDSR